MGKLSGKNVAVLVADGFEEIELTSPVERLREEGATVTVVSPNSEKVKGWDKTNWGREVNVDVELRDASPGDYDALLLPGGVMNPDKLRTDELAQTFVRSLFEAKKPIAAICHGPWTFIDAGIAGGLTLTGYHSIKTDLENAGASWKDEAVVVDQGVVTSRTPDDLLSFNDKMVEEFAEGKHERASSYQISES